MIKRIDFSKYTSIRIGPTLDVTLLETPEDIIDGYLLGGGNNVLISPTPPPLMMLSKIYDFIRLEEGKLHIGARTPNGKVVSFCKKHNIANFEFLSHLPGTIGGALKMNAGLKAYEIFNHLIELRTDKGIFKKEKIDHGYRYADIDGVIFEASFHIQTGFEPEKIAMFKKMRSNQPSDPSAGSCFKNPKGDYAGRLIEAVGLKGGKIGDMAFSEVHANFLVNLGKGTFEEAMALITLAQDRVKKQFDIVLELEVIVL
jgi:UDP-N-acetylmuramate dehydrogenase